MNAVFPTRQTSPLCALCTRRLICARVSACLDAAEREAMGEPLRVFRWRRIARGDYEGRAGNLVARVQRQGGAWWWTINVTPGLVGLGLHGDEATLKLAQEAVEAAVTGGEG